MLQFACERAAWRRHAGLAMAGALGALLLVFGLAHGDGSFARRLAQLARLDLLILDDFAIARFPVTFGDLVALCTAQQRDARSGQA